ncbi:hypothetical protein VNO80_18174 [Phaseolus coccineus]|uniref:Uncharacterized protein n=1 Tax=Phaseolus coccineus TaxID=3886 RepID=A0AAN9QZ74_PHACN
MKIEGLPSTHSIGDLPPDLHCPLCNNVTKDAVLTSKCCFKSFCIRDYIISKCVFVCGATNTLVDELLPNKTLRDTINHIVGSGNAVLKMLEALLKFKIWSLLDVHSLRFHPQPHLLTKNLCWIYTCYCFINLVANFFEVVLSTYPKICSSLFFGDFIIFFLEQGLW